jgi:NADPH-dependent 2,4-dienoyl-CoA reductase/sulfur reductase-like enzyme
MVLRVAVVGAGAAGMSAASRVKRLLRDKAEVVVFEKSGWVSFALCGTPYYLGCRVKRLEELLYYSPEEFTKKRGIKINLYTEVVDVEADARRIRYRSRSGEEGVYEYDYLVLATGAKPRIPRDWLMYRNVFALHSLDDADAIRKYVVDNNVKRVAVIGGGYTGIEAADNIAELGREVVLIHSRDHLANKVLDSEMAETVEEKAKSKGVELVLGKRAVSIEGDGGVARRVVLEGGDSVEADAFIVSPGIVPDTALAEKAGLRIGETGAIWTDERMRTSNEYIYAVGDAVETRDIITGGRVWWPFAPAANKQGYVAGTNIAGGDAVFPGVLRSSAFGAFGLYVAATGLREGEASKYGFKPVAATLTARTRAHYFGGGPEIKLKVIADEDTGRLLGAQAVSEDVSAFWRVSVVAALIWGHGTVWDLFSYDISYWPGANPVWDPIVVAARLLLRHFAKKPWKTLN